MDLHFTDEQRRFRAEMQDWLRDNLERPWLEELRDPANDEDALFEKRRQWQAKLHEAGYLGMDWPAEWGGRGATAVEKAAFLERASMQERSAMLGRATMQEKQSMFERALVE